MFHNCNPSALEKLHSCFDLLLERSGEQVWVLPSIFQNLNGPDGDGSEEQNPLPSFLSSRVTMDWLHPDWQIIVNEGIPTERV